MLICKICEKPFQKNKHASNQTICNNPECKREAKRRKTREWARIHKAPTHISPKYRVCAECYSLFRPHNWQHIICSEECKQDRQKTYNKNYKRDHAPARKPRKPKFDPYLYRDTPQPEKHVCQTCGALTINRFHCRQCLNKMEFSEQYPEFIYHTSNDMI